jgi:DNA polymerase-3 subunit delta'
MKGGRKHNTFSLGNTYFYAMLFKDIIGHTALKESLIREVNSNRIAHAKLFLGKPGFGGLPMALGFVQYLMCENRGDTDSCGVCASCKKIQDLHHPDVHFSFPTVQANAKTSDEQFDVWRGMILENPYAGLNEWVIASDPKGRKPIISTHQSKEILKKLSLKSYEGKQKISIVWLADEMNPTCANKLLKIIEEPPAETVFILIADSSEYILPTVLSRTQLVKIKQPEDQEVLAYLQPKAQVDEQTLKSIVSRAEGDLSNALTLLANQGGESENRELFIELMRVCYKKQVLPMMEWAEKMAKKGKGSQKGFIRYALFMVRQSIMKNYTGDQLSNASPEELGFLDKFARFITANNVLDFTTLFDKAHYSLDRNAHAKILFTTVTFEVMRYIHKA